MTIELESAIQRWTVAGLLSDESATRIRAYESGQASGHRVRLPIVLGLTFGGIMLTAGLILFVSAHWAELSPLQRMILLISAVGGSHLAAALNSERFPSTAVALHAVGTTALGGAIFLAGQIFNLEEHWPTGLLLWAAGALLGSWLLPQWPQLTLAAVLLPGWLIAEWTDLVSSRVGASDVVPVGIALLAICYLSVPSVADSSSSTRYGPTVYRWIGGLALIPSTIAVAAHHPWNVRSDPGWMESLGWCVALAGPLVFAFAYRRQNAWVNGITAFWILSLHWIAGQAPDAAVYAWCAIGCAGMIWWGVFEFRPERVNLGMASFALTIACFFFSNVMDKLGRSTSLMILGFVFLGGGWYWEKVRRQLVAQSRAGSLI